MKNVLSALGGLFSAFVLKVSGISVTLRSNVDFLVGLLTIILIICAIYIIFNNTIEREKKFSIIITSLIGFVGLIAGMELLDKSNEESKLKNIDNIEYRYIVDYKQ